MFEIDEDGGLQINKIECRTVPEYKVLLHRDKGGKIVGDNIGRKKYYAFAELLFVYLVHSPLSLYRDLDGKARVARSLKHVRASLGDEWVPDKKVEAAAKVFKEHLELSSTYKAYISASRAIYSIGVDIDLFNEQKVKLRKHLIQIQTKLAASTDKEERLSLMQEESGISTRILTIITNIQKLTSTLTSNYDTLDELKKRVAAESNKNSNEIRGGGSLGNREEK